MTQPQASRAENAGVLVCYGLTSVAMALAWHIELPSGLWIGNGIAVVVGLISGMWIARKQARPLWQRWRQQLAYGVLLGVVLAAVTQLTARELLLSIPPVRAELVRLYGLLDTPPGPIWASPILLLVVLTEEFVFRGVVTTWLERRLPLARSTHSDALGIGALARSTSPRSKRRSDAAWRTRRSILIVVTSSLLYTLPLLGSGSSLLVAIGLGLGAIWTAARLLSGGLIVPLVSHVLFSLSTFVCLRVL
ncbi:MAG: CPBP family glutamic-type intramembrane protease [Polyangiaceae bacterium]